MFRPKSVFHTTLKPLDSKYEGPPQIIVVPEALQRMRLYVEGCRDEVSWFGTAYRQPNNTYLIDQVFLLGQEGHSSSTEITEDGWAAFGMNVLKKPGGREILDNLSFWGHSHVLMDVNASAQDDLTVREFAKRGSPWYIRGIFNQRGDAVFSVYDFEKGYLYDDVKWSVGLAPASLEALGKEVEAELKEKVSRLLWRPVVREWRGAERQGAGLFNSLRRLGEMIVEPLTNPVGGCFDPYQNREGEKNFLPFGDEGGAGA